MTEEQKKVYLPQYRIYKPQKDAAKGGVTSWELSKKPEGAVVFLCAANQLPDKDDKGNSRFDWDNKITVCLGENDIGDILAVLNHQKNEAGPGGGKGLYHDNDVDNKVIKFELVPKSGYSIRVSKKAGDKLSAVYHMISPAEGEIIKILLSRAIEVMYRWA